MERKYVSRIQGLINATHNFKKESLENYLDNIFDILGFIHTSHGKCSRYTKYIHIIKKKLDSMGCHLKYKWNGGNVNVAHKCPFSLFPTQTIIDWLA